MFGIGKLLTQVVNREGLTLPQGAMGAIGAMVQAVGNSNTPVDTQKALYMAALSHALDKAGNSQFFNLQTHINDLNVKLGNIGQSQDVQTLTNFIQQNQQAQQSLSEVVRSMQQMSSGIVRNLK